MINLPNYIVTDGFDKMDFNKVTVMLKDVFWSIDIKENEVRQGARNSALLVAVFHLEEQVGYARVISDKTRFAYIMDVVVDKNYRKKGIGQLMINTILKHPELKDVYQWLLKTKDAHGVYEKAGFRVISDSDSWMGIMKDRPNR